ncbi:hypothetical protein [Nocardia sp. alder85J]|uniref:hypothetical protein n=1 Tax=Nocardia sp. alder85J TaxID=2862949 RepID=UPI001CD28186|nr:hypothetical protein [Nocardia sp. alder85J]MCX4092475.1 hypothetical protein [Nocardia sp. alder85J]
MYGDHDNTVLDELVSHRHVVEILDLLSESGCTTALLARLVRAQGTDLASALRLIAAHGLLTGGDHGSWDDPLTGRGPIRLTERGEAVAQVLSNPQRRP